MQQDCFLFFTSLASAATLSVDPPLALFGPGQVLEIRDLATDELVKRNHYCCPKCIALTGFYLEKLEKKAPAGREWWAMGCRDCGESWETLR